MSEEDIKKILAEAERAEVITYKDPEFKEKKFSFFSKDNLISIFRIFKELQDPRVLKVTFKNGVEIPILKTPAS